MNGRVERKHEVVVGTAKGKVSTEKVQESALEKIKMAILEGQRMEETVITLIFEISN